MKHQKHIMSNGLRVVMIPRNDTGVITVMLGFGVGSRDEPENLAGLSHFVEHMSYKGTKKRPKAKTVAEFIDDIGGVTNAYTGKEYTVYYAKTTSEHLPRILDYLSDNIVNSANLENDVEHEKSVILEDINMHKDRPMEEVAEIFEEAVFPQKSLGKRIIGVSQSVANITRENIIEYRNRYYVADNALLIIAGDYAKFKDNEILRIVERYFILRRGNRNLRKKSEFNCNFTYKAQSRKTKQSNLIIGFPAPGLISDEWMAIKMLSKILGGSMSSRMYREIRENRGLAYAITSGYLGYSDLGALYTQAGVSNNNIFESITALIIEYQKIVSRGINLSELKRAEEIISNGILINNEGSEALARQIISMKFQQNKLITSEELIDKYKSIKKEDVMKVAEKYINFNNMIISLVGPRIKDIKLNELLKRISRQK